MTRDLCISQSRHDVNMFQEHDDVDHHPARLVPSFSLPSSMVLATHRQNHQLLRLFSDISANERENDRHISKRSIYEN
jgi:hypothetical protein